MSARDGRIAETLAQNALQRELIKSLTCAVSVELKGVWSGEVHCGYITVRSAEDKHQSLTVWINL